MELHRLLLGVVAHHVVRLRVNRQPQIGLPHLARERIDLRQRIDLVAPQFHAVGPVVVGRENLDDVAAHAEAPAPEIAVIAVVEDLHQPRRDLLAPHLLALLEHQQHAVVGFRRTQSVDAGDRGDDHAIAALEQRARGRQPQLVELFIDGRLLLDVQVGGRDIGFGLVVIVVTDEVLDRIRREEVLELLVELCREDLVVRHDQRGPLERLDHLGHGEGLARAGDAQQHLVLVAVQYASNKLLDRLALVPSRLVVDAQAEAHVY